MAARSASAPHHGRAALLRGAALNAVEIAEHLIKRGLV